MGRSVVVALGLLAALALFLIWDYRQAVQACEARSIASLREEAKVWIVTRLVKSRHPYSGTAIPDGTPTSAIEYWGATSESLRDMAFFTELEGGIAYNFHFGRDCGFEVFAQRCPRRRCRIGDLVNGA